MPSSSQSDRIHILIVDDHPAICEALTKCINNQLDMEVVASASTAEKAVHIVDTNRVDVVVVDISLPDTDGLQLIAELQDLHPRLPTIVYSQHNERIYAEQALQSGARGYIMKSAAPEKIITAIRTVRQGRIFLSEKMRARTLNNLTKDRGSESGLNALTDREQAVFEAIGRGENLEDISERMGITQKTAEHHRRQTKEKLGLETTGELLQHAIAWIHSRPDNMEQPSS